VLIEIPDEPEEALATILQVSEAAIATAAEQCAHHASRVVMIDGAVFADRLAAPRFAHRHCCALAI
jgi:hypothetical protein